MAAQDLKSILKEVQKTATAPQATLTAPQATLSAPGTNGDATKAAPSGGAHSPGDTVKAGGKSYTVVKFLQSGGEGDIYVVTDKRRQYALKLCHPGFYTNTKVIPALQKLKGKGYLADIIDYGSDFELLEYIPGGSAAEAGIKGNTDAILAIALKTAMALDQMHKVGIIHKDVKPANILLKDRDSWDSVLCDFGIADVMENGESCVTSQVRTPIYAAPEVYDPHNAIFLEGKTLCELTPKADFYSLGMTILSLWLGEGAFKAQEGEMAIAKTKGRIAVPSDMPDPLARICRGLLIKDPLKRWDLGEILRTMDGENIPVDEDLIIADLNITYNASRHQIANTPKDLAKFMLADMDLAKKYLYRGQIERWLKPYPELALEIHDIVEKRHPLDQDLGLMAVVYKLDKDTPFYLKGISKETGEKVEIPALTLKDVGNFCNTAVADPDTVRDIASGIFKEWVWIHNKAIANELPSLNEPGVTFMVRVQMLDPLSDINLCNDPSDPDYAMTQEGIGRLFNKIYNIYWSRFGGDSGKLVDEWEDPKYAPLNRQIPLYTLVNVINNFDSPEDHHYITDFFDTKGQRFKQQRSWFVYCTDRNSDDYRKKAGPKDNDSRMQIAMMKVIKGYGVNPEYAFSNDGSVVTSREEVFAKSKKVLKTEWLEKGLAGLLCIFHQEDPNADLSPRFAYEKLLLDYVEDLRRIDPELYPVSRFDEARDEAGNILSRGKARVHGLSIRSTLQRVAVIIFAVIPAIVLITMLVFSIIDNPILDVTNFKLEGIIWILGIIIAAIIFFESDSEGCLVPLIGGAIGGGLLVMLVKFLGQFILYFFVLAALAVTGWFTYRTVFLGSSYAKQARKFNKPGFDEEVLEPLYYAFSNEISFDSSLNGAFNDQDISLWNGDIKTRRRDILIFIGAIWVLIGFSLLVPKSERFDRFSAPVVQAWFPALEKVEPYLDCPPLKQGDKGEDVRKLQQFLLDKGYTTGKPDGSFGPGTKKALEEFQKANDIFVTGGLSKKTQEKINKIVAKEIKAERKAARKAAKEAEKTIEITE